MSQPVPSAIGGIVTALAAYLADRTGIDTSRVIVTSLPCDENPKFAASQDILLRPMAEQPEVGIIDGAGRFDNRRKRVIEVSARTRVLLDPAGQDLVRLTDASLGHFALEDKICDALELYYPSDTDDNAMCLPLRVGRLTDPRPMRNDRNWVFSTFAVEVEYMRDLDTSRI